MEGAAAAIEAGTEAETWAAGATSFTCLAQVGMGGSESEE